MTPSPHYETDLWNGPLALEILSGHMTQGVVLGWYVVGPLAFINFITVQLNRP